jgi:predicted RNA binding protein YcfA (HicA-like mRNA interferase family)
MSYRPKVRELLPALRRLGCRPHAVHGGSHQKWTTPAGAALIVVISHPGAEVSRTVLSCIRRILRRERLVLDLGAS